MSSLSDVASASASFTTGHQAAPYTTFSAYTRYRCNHGILQAPVAERGAPCELIAVCGSWGVRIVEWVAERMGAIPEMMKPDPSLVLLHSEVTPVSSELTAEGITRVYRISGFYEYDQAQPPAAYEAAANIADTNGPWSPDGPSLADGL